MATLETVPVDLSGINRIDSLLNGVKWQSTNLTFSFMTAGSSWIGYDIESEPYSGFRSLADTQQNVGRNALTAWEQVCNLTFEEVSEPAKSGVIRFGYSSLPTTSWAYLPDPDETGGDIWFGTGIYSPYNPVVGNYDYMTYLHEIGHALGLKHPHEAEEMFPVADVEMDSMNYSIMSYQSYAGDDFCGYSNAGDSYAQTPMVSDVAAVQYLYGANYSYNSNDTVYKFSPDAGKIFMTVWDGGGNDTYNLEAYAYGVQVDLNPGAWSTFSKKQLAWLNKYDDGNPIYAYGNVANALLYCDDTRSLIENAIGGAGNDVLKGNEANNVLNGKGGNDTLDGRTGNDWFSGGLGSDTYLFGRGCGNDVILANSYNNKDSIVFANDVNPLDLNFTVSGNNLVIGFDEETLTVNGWFNGAANQVNKLKFGDDGAIQTYRVGNDNKNNIVGTMLSEWIYGLAGNDSLDGRGGADSVYGGAGNDRIYYDADDVVIDGGSGNDILDASKVQKGQTLSIFNFTAIENLVGGSGNDTLAGDQTANILNGNSGNDILVGEEGNDTLTGGVGSDQYWFGRGCGNDVIFANSYNNKDSIVFANDVNPLDLSFTVSGNNLVIGLDDENLTVNGWFNAAANQVNQLKFGDDGAIQTYRVGNDNKNNIIGTTLSECLYGLAGNDTLDGRSGEDCVYGGAGNDRLFGSDGNDTLGGGTGNDILNGGCGNDVYLFDTAFGADSITGSILNGNDCVKFGGQFTIENLMLSTAGVNLTINNGADNILTVENWAMGGSYAPDHYQIQGIWYNTNGHDWQRLS